MSEIGYTLCSVENGAQDLIEQAVRAEEAGFAFAKISDHRHRGSDGRGGDPFVWGVLGALSQATEELRFATDVDCPAAGGDPAQVAQAAATAAALLPDRFSLGVGSAESPEERALGDHWPPVAERHERLEEAIEIIRLLWEGELTNHRGRFYTVENARLQQPPEEPPPILVAATGERSVELARLKGDGLIGTTPAAEPVRQFRDGDGHGAGGDHKPAYGQLHVCWGADEEEAQRTALEWGPGSEERVVCGPDPERHLAAIEAYLDAGYDHVFVHQIGPDQDDFIDFYEREILPVLR
jgi:coenzyme F420-dependent glucose-6-phosphate dehydrogenase